MNPDPSIRVNPSKLEAKSLIAKNPDMNALMGATMNGMGHWKFLFAWGYINLIRIIKIATVQKTLKQQRLTISPSFETGSKPANVATMTAARKMPREGVWCLGWI
jgi:hypothetical protein